MWTDPTTLKLEAVPVTFQADGLCVDLASVLQNYHDCRRRESVCGKVKRARTSSGRDFDAFFEKDLLWTQAGDVGGVTEEALLATRSPVVAVGLEAPVSQSRYVKLPRSFTDEVRSKRSESKATTRPMDTKNAAVKKLELKVGCRLIIPEKLARCSGGWTCR